VVDLRVGSPTLGHWFGIQLSADEKKQLLIPPEFAHGFCVLSPVAEVQYKCTNFHTPSAEKTLAWDDEEVGISWPVKNPILSDRDREMGTSFRDYVTKPDFSY
jgi:dTDP-4-dehydrorhamnose 3,5-epimerase